MNKKEFPLKLISIFTLILGACIFAYLPGKKSFNVKSASSEISRLHAEISSLGSIKEYYANYFAQKEKDFWKEFESKTGLTHKQILEQRAKWSNDFYRPIAKKQKEARPLSKAMRKKANLVIKDFGINPRDITVCHGVLGLSQCFSDDWTIWINEEQMNMESENIQKFIIAHELAHVIHKDASLYATLNKILNGKHQDLLATFSKIQEARADAFGLTQNKEYCDGAIESFSILLKQRGDFEDYIHPKNSERLQTAQTISDLLDYEKTMV